MSTALIDSTLCPLCGANNRCAIERGASLEDCWCASTAIATHMIDAIPAKSREQACICPQCAAKGLSAGADAAWNS